MTLPPALQAVVVRLRLRLRCLSRTDAAPQAAAPSAALEAYRAAGGRQPGDAARDAAALSDAVAALPPAAAGAAAAAQAAARAHAALLAALRRALPPPPAPDCMTDGDGCSGADGDEALPSPAALPPPDEGALAGIATAVLQARHRGRCWGDWVAVCSDAAHGLERSADLCAAIAAAVADAPLQLPVQHGAAALREGGEAPLSAESADAMAQLWALAPFADEHALDLLIAAATAARV